MGTFGAILDYGLMSYKFFDPRTLPTCRSKTFDHEVNFTSEQACGHAGSPIIKGALCQNPSDNHLAYAFAARWRPTCRDHRSWSPVSKAKSMKALPSQASWRCLKKT